MELKTPAGDAWHQVSDELQHQGDGIILGG